VYHQYTLKLEGADRDALRDDLEKKGIPSMLYYPVPVHRQKMFGTSGISNLNLPVTDWLTGRVISLPMHTELDEEQLNYITTNVLDFVHR
jgi:dTDP-4-amino-4,6-dideoxygalactose transaminase